MKGKIIIFIFLTGILGLYILVTYSSIRGIIKDIIINQHSNVVEGRIIDYLVKEVQSSDSPAYEVYHPIIEYKVGEKLYKYTTESSYRRNIAEGIFTKGSTFKIRYNILNPKEAIDYNPIGLSNWTIDVTWGAVFFNCFVLAVVFLYKENIRIAVSILSFAMIISSVYFAINIIKLALFKPEYFSAVLISNIIPIIIAIILFASFSFVLIYHLFFYKEYKEKKYMSGRVYCRR